MDDTWDVLTKKSIANAILNRDSSAFIHLDPRTPGVVIPRRLMHQSQVVLQVGWNMPVPIPDLRVDDDGIFGTLSFRGQPFTCTVPWSAVFAVVGEDAKGKVWAEDMPTEVADQINEAERRDKADTQAQEDGANPVVSLFEWRLTHGRNAKNNPFELAKQRRRETGSAKGGTVTSIRGPGPKPVTERSEKETKKNLTPIFPLDED